MSTNHFLLAWLILAVTTGAGFAQTSLPTGIPAPFEAATPADLARIAGWRGAAVNSGDTFRFAVLGDNTGGHVEGIFEQAVAQVNLLRPDFVMCIGDYVEGFEKDQAGAEKEWDEAEGILGKLDAPFFYTLGNHDAPNQTYRQAYARLAQRSPTAGRPWYSFNYRACHFVVFDSTATEREIPGLAEQQWAWLAKDLAASAGAKHTFIFEHHPIFGDRGDWMRLRKMLHEGKTTIFSGHDHSLSFAIEHGIPYVALGPTGGFGGTGKWENGSCHQFAWVTVSDGQPRIAIVPVGHILPYDLRLGRQSAARRRALSWGAEMTPITRAGGQTTFTLPNASDVEATYTFSWTSPPAWFGGKAPAPETVTVPAGKSIQRQYKLSGVGDTAVDPPAMEFSYHFTIDGTEGKGEGGANLFARALLEAVCVNKIAIDGRLDDWAGVAGHSMGGRWQVGDASWKGTADSSGALRIGYDDQNVYVAMDVTDDVLFTQAKEDWRRDGVEVFWDPRPAAAAGESNELESRGGIFAAPCRQLAVTLPEEGQPAVATITPAKHDPAPKLQSACRRREGGYTVELAIPLATVGQGFKPVAGTALRMDFVINDRDEADPPEPAAAPAAGAAKPKAKPKPAPTKCITMSGYAKPSYRTFAYADVTFK